MRFGKPMASRSSFTVVRSSTRSTTLSPNCGRQGRDAQIDLASGHGRLDASVLRNPALRDVQVGHDLDARRDGRGQRARRRRHFVKRAVHAVADFEILLERLKVNVTGPRLDGLGQHRVHVLDDRGRGGALDVDHFIRRSQGGGFAGQAGQQGPPCRKFPCRNSARSSF